jgi:hypothetical protein
MLFIQFFLPALLRRDWITAVLLIIIVVGIGFGWKERFEDEWNRRR